MADPVGQGEVVRREVGRSPDESREQQYSHGHDDTEQEGEPAERGRREPQPAEQSCSVHRSLAPMVTKRRAS